MQIIEIILLTAALTLFSSIQFNPNTNMPDYDYQKAWDEVTKMEDQQLPESALKKVNEIYDQARRENNSSQRIKAIIHILKFTEYKEENAFVKNLNRLEEEVANASFPTKSVLQSMLAEVYWNYYQNNRYRFNQRSQTVDFDNKDISTWSLEKIVEEVLKNYQESILDAEKLKEIHISDFDEILDLGNKEGRNRRPTLYDFLAHRAVDFFANQEADIVRPAYSFNISSADYLLDASAYAKLKIGSEDSLSYKLQALSIFQDLIDFHLNDKESEALFDIDLKRILFVNQYLTLPNKQDLYLKALENLEQKYIKSKVSTIASFYMANVWRERAGLYNPLQTDDHKWDNKTAFEICQKAIDRFPESEGAAMARNLQHEIQFKIVSAELEKVNVPQEPFRALVRYKNFSELHWRAVKVARDEINSVRDKWRNNYDVDREQKFIEHFAGKAFIKSGNYQLPVDGDYQQHSVEVKLEDLPVGDYMILFSANKEFDFNQNAMCYAFTTISNISYINRNLDNGTTEMYVLNRTTGLPIPEASVQIFIQEYNNRRSRYEWTKGGVYTSDKDGRLVIPNQNALNKSRYNSSFYAAISWQNDQIDTRDIDSDYSYSGSISQYEQQPPVRREMTVFFLDRAIYRPGQTLYFKGLLYETEGKNPAILPNRKMTLTFYDVNHQVVAEQAVTTNEYGTFNGTFTTPTSGLTGQMFIQIDDDQSSRQYFRVEEYKRPKFEVVMNPVEGSFRLNDIIPATGIATAYSGANIDGAKVAYRVVRQARFPFWWWCRYGYYPSSPEMEITNGITESDETGKFTIDFKAIPDESVDRSSSPTFNYVIYVDVTDINGETHSAQQSIGVGYQSLMVGVNMPDLDKADVSELKSIGINTTNLSGTFQPAKGTINIWKLSAPEKAYRNRMWEQPDQFIYGMDKFRASFPNDLYQDENNFYQWKKEKEVLQTNFDTKVRQDFSINNLKSWKPGKYVLEIKSKDKDGNEVSEVAYFDVHDSKSKALSYPEINFRNPIKTNGEPGEKAMVQIGSSENVHVLYEIERDGKLIQKEYLKVNNETRQLEIPILEEYRGNIAAHFTFVKNNRLYYQSQLITVPYSNKELDIQFETFRDKLQPGQEEQWKLKISGKKADQVMAEMVATLYDESLDVFAANSWYASFYPSLYARLNWASPNGFVKSDFRFHEIGWNSYEYSSVYSPSYDALNWFGLDPYYLSGYFYMEYADEVYFNISDSEEGVMRMAESAPMESESDLEEIVVTGYTTRSKKELSGAIAVQGEDSIMPESDSKSDKPDFSNVKIRSNFNETAFFYPNLQTNEKGEIIINFTIPEALTRWKMLGFAHTKDLKSGSVTNSLVTQKELMVVPNQPRFFRENDKMYFSAKISSLVEKELSGEARLEFFDALTMQPVASEMKMTNNLKPFLLAAKQSTNLEWFIEIPEGLQAITYRIVAKAGNFSDGEEMVIPVVTNRMLITESLPLPIRGNESKTFTFEKLANNTSTTLKSHRYTLEFTSNPAWYAVQALPYLMEYPYECTEQTFSRFYANSIATHVANSNPKIKRVFDTWATIQPDALLSNLEKNQELKTALLEETPWVLQAKDESQRKRSIALLFDLNRMANEQERALDKIMKAQSGNGGFSWFPGFPEDRYMTQHIVAGLGHLDVMGVKSVREDNQTWQMVRKALGYLDNEMDKQYRYLKAQEKKGLIKLDEYEPGYADIHYLYTRSYFKDVAIAKSQEESKAFFLKQCKKYWAKRSIYMQGMIALALHRNDESEITKAIIRSLNERALHSEEMGMYWKYESGYYWYQAPIETQALMIEVYDEVANDQKAVEELKIWLLKQKQTQDWKTTKATTEAVYALLRRGSDMLASDNLVEITIGNEKIDPRKLEDTKIEAGTGYFKTSWSGSEITPEMGTIKVEKKDAGVAWGAVYWQYFEQLDKITPAETPLKLKKQLFLQKNTDRGPVITPITEDTKLEVGDLVKVRIELRVDRAMEYIHLKDMRASGFEPVETLSRYKYQDGLHYYESPRDMATNFFIGWLSKGTYVFEYPLRVSQRGDFSNGVTTIQCMYAPEFSSHSEGIRVQVE